MICIAPVRHLAESAHHTVGIPLNQAKSEHNSRMPAPPGAVTTCVPDDAQDAGSGALSAVDSSEKPELTGYAMHVPSSFTL